jgi:hypothetical protein
MASVVAPLDLEDIPSPSQPLDVLLPEIPHPFFAHVNQSPSLPFQTEFNYIAEFENLMMALYGTKKYTTLKNGTLEISLPQVPLHTIQPCSGFSKKVTKQRLYWKGIQELSRLYTDWTQNFSVIPLESSINCKGCFHEIGPIGNFCFFVKSLREVSFALQPELNREEREWDEEKKCLRLSSSTHSQDQIAEPNGTPEVDSKHSISKNNILQIL